MLTIQIIKETPKKKLKFPIVEGLNDNKQSPKTPDLPVY